VRKYSIYFLVFTYNIFAYTNYIHSKEITSLSSSTIRNPKIQANDLVKLVGLPFAWQEYQSFNIDNTNSNGEAVGTAYFKNPDPLIGKEEIIAWYWHPQNGFQIIASQSELLKVYGKDWKIPFLFYKLVINESGVVAGSFLINQAKGFNEWPWFWWSLDQGIHLSVSPTVNQIVKGINDNGFLLIEETGNLKFTLSIKNIHQQEYSQIFDFQPRTDFQPGFEENLIKTLRNSNSLDYGRSNKKLKVYYHWYPFSLKQFDNDLKITGYGSCWVKFVKDIQIHIWEIQIRYEIDNCKALFFIEKIEDKVYPGLVQGQINNMIIYEKIFNK